MSVSNNEYNKMTKKASPGSPVLLDCLKAFLVGGIICCFAEGLSQWFKTTKMTEDESKGLVSVILIGVTAVLTGLGVFDNIAKHAGAGTMVPITGFANSIVSPAMEFKSGLCSRHGGEDVFHCGSGHRVRLRLRRDLRTDCVFV